MKRSRFMIVGILGWVSILTTAARADIQMKYGDAKGPPSVVFDNDVDFDDTVTLAALAKLHLQGRIDLLAVTVNNNGAGLPGNGYKYTRCLLDGFGLAHVPVADETYPLLRTFPDILRFTFDLIHAQTIEAMILDMLIPACDINATLQRPSAPSLLAAAIANAKGRLTLIATGPLTNVAGAIELLDQRYPQGAAALIDRAYIQGGGFGAPIGPEDFGNIWGDPAAAQAIFRALRPGALHLVPDEATRHVPVTSEYVASIVANQQTLAGTYVARLMNHPIMTVWWCRPGSPSGGTRWPRSRPNTRVLCSIAGNESTSSRRGSRRATRLNPPRGAGCGWGSPLYGAF